MPIYEYSCSKCGEFEVHQSMSDPTLKRCPTCKSKVSKLISATAFQLKGGGWYQDAYHKKPSSGSKPEKTAESAPAPAATPAPSSGSSD